MPEKKTIEKAHEDKRGGKAPTTQAGEFVREEIHKIRRGEHGARSPEQAIAIGLSEARRAGVDLPPPKKGRVKERTWKSAGYAYEVGQQERRPEHRPRVARAVIQGAENGAAGHCVARGSLASCKASGLAAKVFRAIGSCQEGGVNQRAGSVICCLAQSGANAQAAHTSNDR